MMKRALVLVWCIVGVAVCALAGPGMWLPIFIGANIEDIQATGGRLTAEQIYDANGSSLKDAVMIFGGGCTGEMVSESGLILTNYHCGEDAVSALSTPERDLMAQGYAAQSLREELPCEGLDVRHLVRMEDVSDRVKSLGDTATVNRICVAAAERGRYEAEVEEMYYGNQFILMVYEVFRDVRLVVAPPGELGGFGGETDNWVWPRHTADFTLFRVYAGEDNGPAEYSANNKPYRPKKSLRINAGGVEEGDFAMVMGFPGTTNQYLTAGAVEALREKVWPGVVALRGAEMAALEVRMQAKRKTAIDYASHYSSIANGKKRTAGEIDCTDRAGIVRRMREEQRVLRGDARMDSILGAIDGVYDERYVGAELTRRLMQDTWRGSRTLMMAMRVKRMMREGVERSVIEDVVREYFGHIDMQAERETLKAGLKALKESGVGELPEMVREKSGEELAMNVTSGVFGSEEAMVDALRSGDARDRVSGDVAVRLAEALMEVMWEKREDNSAAEVKLHELKRQYTKRLMELRPDSLIAPDANFTMRVAYGKVEAPRTGIEAVDRCYTDAEGILAKNETGIEDYALSQGVKEKLRGDYGRWADKDGTLHTCFVGSVHTTGGNSGSPTLNSRGELIGLNFDRIWNGIASDYKFDAERSRNISVDIRYVLYVIEKICGGGRVIGEMDIVGVDNKE